MNEQAETRHADESWMRRAIKLARRGQGAVEPNPMVGCVLAKEGSIVGEGWHARFGGPHAEQEALQEASEQARGSTAYVTLEPCSHQGKTPPCADALIEAGVARVVAAMEDPFPEVSGRGLERLRAAGLTVDAGVLQEAAEQLNAPYLTRLLEGRPWLIGKWAMTLDGKLAAADGDSRWISNAGSRTLVHQLRGRMDAVMVGSGTVLIDDPLLTARPAGIRQALRIVCDRRLRIPIDAQLVKSCGEQPVLIATTDACDHQKKLALTAAGCELLELPARLNDQEFLRELMATLGQRQLTNLLVEGGSQLLGALFDADLIDEAWAFVAAKILGGEAAPSPIGGAGRHPMDRALNLADASAEILNDDVLIRGVLHAPPRRSPN